MPGTPNQLEIYTTSGRSKKKKRIEEQKLAFQMVERLTPLIENRIDGGEEEVGNDVNASLQGNNGIFVGHVLSMSLYIFSI